MLRGVADHPEAPGVPNAHHGPANVRERYYRVPLVFASSRHKILLPSECVDAHGFWLPRCTGKPRISMQVSLAMQPIQSIYFHMATAP